MGYVSKSLAPGEQIVFEGRFYWLKKLVATASCMILVGFIWAIPMWTTEMVITNRRLIYKRGMLARKTEELSLHRIEEINVNQSILGRILGYGKIVCHGTGGSKIEFPTISRPMAFRRALQEAQARRESENA